MKAILIDINVVLDVLLNREPHAKGSAAVWAAIESGSTSGLLAAHAVTTIHYLVRNELGASRAKRVLTDMLRVFDVAPVDASVIRRALELQFADFEDAVSAAAAESSRCDFIVTRDPKGFHASPIRPLTPELILPLLWER